MVCPGGFRVPPRPPGNQGAAGRRREPSERTDPAAALPGCGLRCHAHGQLSPSPPWLPSRRDRDCHPAPAGTVRAFPLSGSLKPFFFFFVSCRRGTWTAQGSGGSGRKSPSRVPRFAAGPLACSSGHPPPRVGPRIPPPVRRSPDGLFPLSPSLRGSPPWVPSAARRPDRQTECEGRCPPTPGFEALTWAPAPLPAGSPDPRSSSAPPARQSPGSRGARELGEDGLTFKKRLGMRSEGLRCRASLGGPSGAGLSASPSTRP